MDDSPVEDGTTEREIPRVAIPISISVFAAGLLLLLPEFPLLGAQARWLRVTVTILLVVTCAMALSRLAAAGVSTYALRRPTLAPATGVARVAVRILIAILAILMGLQSLGVPVTPLLTTLGIGSLAVALALQDTLANFFAGLYLLADRPVRPGDYIRLLEGGAEGYVDSIGWRSSRLRTLIGNTIIVPNQKLSQTILTNYQLPYPDMVLTVGVRVPFEANADAVEGYLLDEIQQASRDLPELVSKDPVVRLVELGDSGMIFQCVLRVRDFEAQGRAAHEVRKRIVTRLKREGVPLSYPQQVVHEAPGRERARFPRPE
ncbi:MAG: mechanosensitive ion channel family protein [Deltaproteobacteria bacterium]|nr:mechanosensitive ion channel family protein [Deltaproteobacteria bacterium]